MASSRYPERDFILYCNTSALVKIILGEKESMQLRLFAEKCYRIAVCRITWVEAKSALRTRERQAVQDLSAMVNNVKKLTTRYPKQKEFRESVQRFVDEMTSLAREAHQKAHQKLEESWKDFTLIDVSDSVLNKAGEFSAQVPLKGYDSVQLATAHELQLEMGQASLLVFASFDRQLIRAAKEQLGMRVFQDCLGRSVPINHEADERNRGGGCR